MVFLCRQKKSFLGFSLLELIIYLGILAIFVMILVNLSIVIFRVKAQSEAKIEVEQNLRFALDKMAQDIKSATGATVNGICPYPSLDLANGTTISFSRYDTGAGFFVLRKTVGVTTYDLTTNKVSIDVPTGDCLFTKISQPSPAKASIQIKLKVIYNAPQNPYLRDIESIGQTTVSLRQ